MIDEKQFLKDIDRHVMTIIKDDGLHRHVRFARPGTSCMHFDLITWPGSLCYTGDMGTFVFSRLADMFEFFRTDRQYAMSRGRQLGINLGYWSEKLDAVDRHDGFKKFDEDKFNSSVRRYFVEWLRDHRDDCSKEERRELWEEIQRDVLDADGDGGGYRKQCAAHDFGHSVRPGLYFRFQDFWETNVEEYTHRFVWCCYALAWGIKQYDDHRVKEQANELTE